MQSSPMVAAALSKKRKKEIKISLSASNYTWSGASLQILKSLTS